MSLSTYVPIGNAIVLLLDPLVEVVIHDLDSETICFIAGQLSQRRIGDSSLLDNEAIEQNLDQMTYPKLNFDGRLIKSISVPVDENLLICINCDVSVFAHGLVHEDDGHTGGLGQICRIPEVRLPNFGSIRGELKGIEPLGTLIR